MPRYKDLQTGKFISQSEATKRNISPIEPIENNYIFSNGKIIKKKCTKCKEIKFLEEFGRSNRSPDGDGRRIICKNCRHLYETPKRREYGRNLCQTRRLQVLIHYGGDPPKCACPPCGEDKIEFLSIDHIHGGGNKHMRKLGLKGGVNFHTWLIKNNYPEGYQVLCMNCNHAKGHYGICPHQRTLKAP
jgi:hypothetical protein